MNKIISTTVSTPLGPMLAGAYRDGICLLEFADRKSLASQLNKLTTLLKTDMIPGSNRHLDLLEQQLSEYFDCTRKHFDIPLTLAGTDFQKKAWDVLRQIPYGETFSYQQQAIALNRPKAVRAVANANANNKISIIIPCHRVIGKDGSLGGYAGKTWRKEFLLDLEGFHK